MSKDSRRTMSRAKAIYPYGVGAILDWGQECFIVLDSSAAGWKHGTKVRLPRLEQMVGAPEGFRLPPVKVDFGAPKPLDVQRFPSWLFCPSCRRMWRWGRAEEVAGKGQAPRCKAQGCGRAILVPMRYVAACEAGHICDIDWHRWAHAQSGGHAPCSPQNPELYFDARGDRGATLDALSIRCGRCGRSESLRDILSSHSLKRIGQRCWGRQPWQSRDDESVCDRPLVVLQRSQTAVHFADIVSALDLTAEPPDGPTDLDEAMDGLVSALGLQSFSAAQPLLPAIAQGVRNRLGREVPDDVLRGWLLDKLGDGSASSRMSAGATADEMDILSEEWPALTTVTPEHVQRANLIVRSDQSDGPFTAELAQLFDGMFLIERLREVRAFRGFRRLRPDADLVPPDLGRKPGKRWLPAIEVFGEGLFIQFREEAIAEWLRSASDALGTRLAEMERRLASPEGAAQRFGSVSGNEARFMMVHTFSHLLMRQLCYESGYGAASVRERLYVLEGRTGVLIYTADGDSEGSLGGLVRQGRRDRIGATIVAALERALWCSNDPICSEVPGHGFEHLTLAACHACALAPETSCSHLNTLLDRELVIGSGLHGVRGYFGPFLDRIFRGRQP